MVTKEMNCESSVNAACSQSATFVKEHPVSSLLMVFGVGLAVGALLSQSLAAPIAHAFQPSPTFAEKLGRQIYDAVAGSLPESLLNRMHA